LKHKKHENLLAIAKTNVKPQYLV